MKKNNSFQPYEIDKKTRSKLMNQTPCVLWITGISGAGKSTLAKHILKFISKRIGFTVLLDGDEIRLFMKSINFKMGYTKLDRGKKGSMPIAKLINVFLKNNINIIYPNVGLNNSATKVWYKTFKKIIYIQISSEINDIIKFNKKELYKRVKKNIVGIDIKPDYNKKADIIIINNFKKPFSNLVNEVKKEIKKII